jgi:hypothetical protein
VVEQVGNVRYAVYELRVRHLLVVRARLWVRCASCRHEAEVDPLRIVRKVGADEQMRWIENRMRCTRCGVRGYCGIRIEWEDARSRE